MSDGTFVRAISDLTPVPEAVSVDGVEHVALPNGWKMARAERATVPNAIFVGSLSGFAGYVRANRDRLDQAEISALVTSPYDVTLSSGVRKDHLGEFRVALANASIAVPNHPFGVQLQYEEFVVWIRSRFVQDENTESLLSLLSSISSSEVDETTDDGVSQVAQTRRGVAFKDASKVSPYWTLLPYRTFREVDQPASLFLLRLSKSGGDKPRFALYEADGGSWQIEAVERIKSYLDDALPQGVAIIG